MAKARSKSDAIRLLAKRAGISPAQVRTLLDAQAELIQDKPTDSFTIEGVGRFVVLHSKRNLRNVVGLENGPKESFKQFGIRTRNKRGGFQKFVVKSENAGEIVIGFIPKRPWKPGT